MNVRVLAAAACAIAASGLAVSAATPAYAQGGEADVAISLVGTTVADGVSGKFAGLILSNNGPDAASGIEFTYDVSGLDTSKATLNLEDCVPDSSGIAVCIIEPDGLANGEHVEFQDFLEVVPGATGDAGSITVSITHAGTDPDESNNTATAPVTIGGTGPDLLVFAPDVHDEADIDLDDITQSRLLDTPVVPGSDAVVLVFVANQGNAPTSGVQMTISLPEHVTFIFPEPECTHAVGDATTTCDYSTIVLEPGYDPDESETYCEDSGTCGWFSFPVNVSQDAPSPASLTGGTTEAWDMQAVQPFSAETELPGNFTTEPIAVDVDPSDNKREFTVFVSEPAAGGGGGGPLPVTGAPALLLGGIGAAVLAAGAVLLVAARRRRVVLTAPDSDG